MDNDSSFHIELPCIKNIFNLADKNLTNDLFEKNFYLQQNTTICIFIFIIIFV